MMLCRVRLKEEKTKVGIKPGTFSVSKKIFITRDCIQETGKVENINNGKSLFISVYIYYEQVLKDFIEKV